MGSDGAMCASIRNPGVALGLYGWPCISMGHIQVTVGCPWGIYGSLWIIMGICGSLGVSNESLWSVHRLLWVSMARLYGVYEAGDRSTGDLRGSLWGFMGPPWVSMGCCGWLWGVYGSLWGVYGSLCADCGSL